MERLKDFRKNMLLLFGVSLAAFLFKYFTGGHDLGNQTTQVALTLTVCFGIATLGATAAIYYTGRKKAEKAIMNNSRNKNNSKKNNARSKNKKSKRKKSHKK